MFTENLPKEEEPKTFVPEENDGYLDQFVLDDISSADLEEYIRLWERGIERESKAGDPNGDAERFRKRIKAAQENLKYRIK